MRTNDYNMIIYLDEKLNEKVRIIQRRLYDLTGSRACLDLWEPHITIGAGPRIKDKELDSFYEDIKESIKGFRPFKIMIKDFDFWDDWVGGKWEGTTKFSKYVIVLDVVVNDKLQKLYEAVKVKVTNKRELPRGNLPPYNPHLTIAFKDLNYEGFLKAREMLREEKFSDETVVDHIAIAKEGPDGRSPEFKRFNFNSV